ncbi:MAG: outer membrane protein assembly factor BamE [Gemmataceae bacterium]|nr:outer membrane protein assembly factor BamE [Gemmataceae bacterium]
MTRRRLIVLLMLLVAAAIGWCFLPESHPLTEENLARIKEGMPIAEVYAILGQPSSMETRRSYRVTDLSGSSHPMVGFKFKSDIWIGGDKVVYVHYRHGDEGEVFAVAVGTAELRNVFERFALWLRL